MRKTIFFFMTFLGIAAAALAQTAPADTSFARGDFAAADAQLSAALAAAPNDATPLSELARLRLYQENRTAARDLAVRALAADPDNALAKRVLAGVAARDAAFAPDVFRIDMPGNGIRARFVATDPLPILKVRANGHDTYFLIDTGGPSLVIDTDFAAEIGLATSAAGQGTFAGGQQAAVARATLSAFAIGALRVRDIAVSVLPTRGFALKPGIRIDGIVGTGFLMHFLATIDYRRGALILKPRSDSAAFERRAARDGSIAVPMWLVGDHFIFARGRTGQAPEGLYNIDTGLAGGGLQATRATLDAAGVTPDESKAQSGAGGGGMVRTIPFKTSAAMGGLTVKDVDGVYTPDGDQYKIFPFVVAGTLSHGFFRSYALTFDFVAMKIVVR